MTAVSMEQVGDDVFLVHGTAVNWTLLREGRSLTLVDAGYPNDADTVIDAITHIGHRIDDVVAVLITHGHVDHIGGLTGFLHRRGAPVYAHPLELRLVRGEVHEQATTWDIASRSWNPRFARWTVAAVRAGGNARTAIASVLPFAGNGPLDVPGHPVPVECGGHTSGHTAFHLPDQGVLLSGDAIITGHPLSRRTGPQLLPAFFAHDPQETLRTLDALRDLAADSILPGHGPAWRGSPRDAVDTVRATTPHAYR